jgi:hypothetical protein
MNHHKTLTPPRRKLIHFHPSAFLLMAQLLLLILHAVFGDLYSQRALLGAVSVVVLVLVVWVINHSPAIPWLTWTLAVPSFVLSLLSAVFSDPTLVIWSSLLEAALYFYAAGSLIAYMLGDEQVTTDELFAVGATFTLLAWGFAYLYQVCETLIPGSFVSGVIVDRQFTFIEFLFLSVTNLSTSGLSDIVPSSAWGRAIIIIEQSAGVGYVAIVVSRLIGLTIQKHNRKRG